MDIPHRLTALEVLAERIEGNQLVIASHFLTMIKEFRHMTATTEALTTAMERNTVSIDALPPRIKAEIDAAVAAVSSPDVVADAAALPGAVAFINASSDKIDAIAVPGPTL